MSNSHSPKRLKRKINTNKNTPILAYKSPKFQKKGKTDIKGIYFESLDEIPCAFYDNFLKDFSHFNIITAERKSLEKITLRDRRLSTDGENALNKSISAEEFGQNSLSIDGNLQDAVVQSLFYEERYDKALGEFKKSAAKSKTMMFSVKDCDFVKTPIEQLSEFQINVLKKRTEALNELKQGVFKEYPDEENALFYKHIAKELRKWKGEDE